jgi:hypothetical protein
LIAQLLPLETRLLHCLAIFGASRSFVESGMTLEAERKQIAGGGVKAVANGSLPG